MKALWHKDTLHSEVRTTEDHIAHGQAIHLKTLYSQISLGTELTIAQGNVPEELHDTMRVPYMEGDFIFPVKYGYSLVGEAVGTGALCHVMHPHQNECLVDPNDIFQIPDDIPPRRAILASNLGTALTGIWDGAVQPGERIAIIGFGMIGSLLARIASAIPATQVLIIETNVTRKKYAEQFGFKLLEDLGTVFTPFDIAFHTSGTQEGLQTAIDLVGLEGRVVEMSWYGRKAVTLDLGGEFHTLRKRIIGSQVSNIPGTMQPGWDRRRRQKAVFRLLRDPAFDRHITHEVTLEEAAALFNQWRTQPPEGLGYCIRY